MSSRELSFDSHMSDTEALMWTVEKDPWLSSAMGTIVVLDTAIDYEDLLARMSRAVAAIPRLRERVVSSLTGVAPPRWVADAEFQLTDHITEVSLAAPGTERQLFDLAADIMTRPFDRTRPLWTFTVVQGLANSDRRRKDRSALVIKLHHSVADGIGAIRLAEFYMDFERETEVPDEVDLRELIEQATEDKPSPDSFREVVTSSFGHLARRQLGLARRAAAEVALWGADPQRIGGAVEGVRDVAKVLENQMGGMSGPGSSSDGADKGGSPLWRERSRHRHIEGFSIDLNAALAAAKANGMKLNDVFVAGSIMAAMGYHAKRGVSVDQFNLSFVVSTRDDSGAGGNAFAPVMVSVPGEPLDAAAALALAQSTMAEGKETAQGSASASTELLAGFATLLPTSVLTRTGRARSAHQDWATSNLRASPITLYIAGGEITEIYPLGPVAGTAFNLTAMSYVDKLTIGLTVDPVAIEAPGELRDHLIDAYAALLALN